MTGQNKSQKIIMGNWKMNSLAAEGFDRTRALVAAVGADAAAGSYKMVLCPPATLLAGMASIVNGTAIGLGGQDCHHEISGAYTGNIAAAMLKDIGCGYVLAGHSERRQYHAETDAVVAAKAAAAHAAGLVAVICVGETDAERTAGRQNDVVIDQIKKSLPAGSSAANTIIAYEPVWAIGTGKSATAEDVRDMHAAIRAVAGDIPLLYGGSVKASTARDILHTPNVDGVLVGGASLKVDEFMAIASAAQPVAAAA